MPPVEEGLREGSAHQYPLRGESQFPLAQGLTGSRPRGRTVVWGEGVIDCIEAEHGRLDGMDLGSRARGVVVGHAMFVPKDHGCVALIKLADRVGLGE